MQLRALARSALRRVIANPTVATPLSKLTHRFEGLPWRRLPAPTGSFSVPVPGAEPLHLVNTVDHPAARALYWRGIDGFEPETLRVFLAYARTATTTVDVGANRGIFTLLAARSNPSGKVYAFEPLPRVREVVNTNIAASNLQPRCVVSEIALSDRSGQAAFVDPGTELPTSARLSAAHYESADSTDDQTVTVTTSRFDDLAVAAERIDLVKIDVEGAEHLVLAGMRKTLERDLPVVFFECLPDGPVDEITMAVDGLAYDWYHLTGQGPQKRAALSPDPQRRWRNWLLVPAGQEPRAGITT